jgi:hypothetical protein
MYLTTLYQVEIAKENKQLSYSSAYAPCHGGIVGGFQEILTLDLHTLPVIAIRKENCYPLGFSE